LIREHEGQQQLSCKLLDEYTRMIDIGTTLVERKDKECQTELSLRPQVKTQDIAEAISPMLRFACQEPAKLLSFESVFNQFELQT
jgi:hypothetical protein